MYAITVEHDVPEQREKIDWQRVSVDEFDIKQMALKYLKDITSGCNNMKEFKSNLTYHASDFEWHLNKCMEDQELHYTFSADYASSVTYLEADKFRAYKLYHEIGGYSKKYLTEYCTDFGSSTIIEEDYNFNN